MEDVRIVEGNAQVHDKAKRCPNCGSAEIEHNPITEKMRCTYCKCEFSVGEEKLEGFVENLQELQGTVIGEGAQNINRNISEIVTCKCTSCGAEILLNASEVPFTKCHWCHTPLSLDTKIPNGTIPDAILPFKVSKEEAFEDFKNAVEKHKFFADKNFLEEFSIDNMRGVYLPYMMVDINGHCKFKGRGQKITKINYGTNDNGNTYESSYDVDIYDIEREFDIQIENLMENANSKQINKKKIKSQDGASYILSTLMPFDIENCVKFNSSLTNGYSFEKRDINIGDISDNMGLKAKDVARYKIGSYLSYDGGINWEDEELEINGQQWKTIYLPVWLYSYTQHLVDGDYTYFLAENARTKELNYLIPLNNVKVLISILVSVVFPILLIIVILMIMSYIKYDTRNRHELETKSSILNVQERDDFIKHKKGQKSSTIKGANNLKIEGER